MARTLSSSGAVPAGAAWRRLRGGRSNLVWSVRGGGADLICKLYDPDARTPLFPNDPAAEAMAIEALAATGLAPAMRRTATCAAGRYLIYDAVAGTTWRGDPAPVTRRLAALHRRPVPAGLRRLRLDADAMLREGDAMLDGRDRARLLALRPPPPHGAAEIRAFLHGDPVPSNVLDDGGRIVFVDWQCPAAGDPILDLAVFLSPSMQIASGLAPLAEAGVARALAAYGDRPTVRRFGAWRALLSWRFACYAAWKVARGDATYADGLTAERALLERLQHQDHDGRAGAPGPG